jgi:hypothetical protein
VVLSHLRARAGYQPPARSASAGRQYPAPGYTIIDPWSIAPHALWLLGLAIILATFSYRDWLGSRHRHAAAPAVAGQGRPWYLVGLLFFCLGMLATSRSTLERAGWAIVLLLVLAQLLLPSLRLARRREPSKPPAARAYEPPQ